MSMRLMGFGLVLFLCGCAPLTIWHRAGVSVAEMERTADACRVEALRDAPVATQVVRAPPVFVPPRRICDAAGNCVQDGGYFLPGPVSTVDPNADLRDRLVTRCMADRGYRPVQIPPCPSGIKAAAPVQATRILPTISDRSCVIRRDDGSWQIVTRG